MIPLSIFLLACAAVYLGAIEAAFSALMRLSLRLVAERSSRPDGFTWLVFGCGAAKRLRWDVASSRMSLAGGVYLMSVLI